jgi:hypothetical protein
MVENPHKFKARNISGNQDDLDEIARLENIFAEFYKEERGGQQNPGKNKKVSMLPMKSSLNLQKINRIAI